MRKKNVVDFVWIIVALVLFVACSESSGESERKYMMAVDTYAKDDINGTNVILDELLKNDSDFYPALFLKGKLLFFTSETEEALKIFNKLKKKYPEYTEARLWAVRCLINEENYIEAKKVLDRELSFNSTDWRFYYQYALVSERMGNYEERIFMLKRAEQHANESGKVYLDLAKLWYALEMNERSKGSLEKASVLLVDNKVLGDSILSLKRELFEKEMENIK